ncbi:MAG TPA: hypothetical protein DEB39_11655 [Planctomycetaceae bacterium]|nr:hypothetical protein [Planctomycetaceae bacterium]
MKIILVQTISEILKVFLFALIILTLLITIVLMISATMKEDVLIAHVIMMAPFIMVDASRISIPMALLMAATISFAKMSGNNEIIALKSLGIAPWRLIWPVLVLGFLCSLVSVWLNDWAVTWGRANMARVAYGAVEDIIFSELRSEHIYTFEDGGGFTIMADGVNDRTLLGVTITVPNESMTITAQEANLRVDLEKSELQVLMRHLKVEGGDTSYEATDDSYAIPLSQFGLAREDTTRPSNMGMKDIPTDIDKQRDIIAVGRRTQAAQFAFASVLGDRDPIVDRQWTRKSREINDAVTRLERLRAEPPRRWANGFCCLFFVWIGAPLAIWMKKSDVFTSFFACFIPILILYYPIMMLGFDAAKNGTMPVEVVWVANLCLGLVGIWFWRHIHRF